MISTAHRFIFLHIPKTGGNSVHEVLLPFSDDAKVSGGFRDGVERFEIKGPLTPYKHAAYRHYAKVVPDIERYLVVATVRHPVARAISWYFSPHRWFDTQHKPVEPEWNLSRFEEAIVTMTPAADFIDGAHAPFIMRFEYLSEDIERLADRLGLPLAPLPRRNVSAALPDMVTAALNDSEVAEIVRNQFARDFEAFGYEI